MVDKRGKLNFMARNLRIWSLVLAVLVAAVAAGCGGSSDESSSGSTKLSLVAYSTPKEAYEELIPAFKKTDEGKDVGFSQSYASSGEQARAIENGLRADVAAFSLEPDMGKLVKAGLVAEDWNKNEYDGFVTNSLVVFLVRKGNPKNIRTWDDLIKPGVEVLEPNPFTSGGAKWNIMAAYGAQLEQGRSEAEALDYVEKLFRNVPVQDKSAREALQTFSGGKGDVLIAYENEAITAQQKGEDVDFVRPAETILIQNPVAALTKAQEPEAQAFVDFLTSDEAQRIFAGKGYRPVKESLLDEKAFPKPATLFTIEKFGGWSKVNDEFFDPENGSIAKIQEKLGVSTGG
jgi:sulfate transport system substrate-binding protein